jgi:hypothetical protein
MQLSAKAGWRLAFVRPGPACLRHAPLPLAGTGTEMAMNFLFVPPRGLSLWPHPTTGATPCRLTHASSC